MGRAERRGLYEQLAFEELQLVLRHCYRERADAGAEGPCAGSEVRRNYGRVHRLQVAKQLVLYVKVQGAVLFAGMLDMTADDSGEAIKNACVQLLTDLDMERNNLTAVATDGAGAMRGSKKGAAKLMPDRAEGPVFTSHCVLHRINFAVVDVFDGKSNCPDVVQELAVEIETSLRYAYSYFNRSTANRKKLQTVGRAFGRCVIPHSLCETRWLSRYLAMKALWQGRDAVVGFLRENISGRQATRGGASCRCWWNTPTNSKAPWTLCVLSFCSPPACKPATSPSGPCTSADRALKNSRRR